MKIIAPRIALAVLFTAALAACSTPSVEQPTSAPTTTTQEETTEPAPTQEPEPTVESLSPEDVFLTVVRDAHPDETSEMPDEYLVSIGEAVCTELDSGSTFYDVALTFINEDEPWSTIGGTITGAAIPTFCPEYMDDMEEFLDEVANL